MNVVYAAPEVAPFSKTGGLADVAGSLPRALRVLGHQVTVVTPRYRSIDPERHRLARRLTPVRVSMGGTELEAGIFEGTTGHNVKVLFVDYPPFFDREYLYGTPEGDYPDNAERFGLFCRVVADLVRTSQKPVDVVHLNDWQTGLVPLFLREAAATGAFPARPPRTVFTIHNIGYQGLFPPEVLPSLGLGWEVFTVEGLEFWGKVSFLKAGIVYSDFLTTVSPTYAREILTPEFGCGLEGVLRTRADSLVGVLNGVDHDVWNPERDPYLDAHFGPGDLSGKARCKKALQRDLGLGTEAKTPLIGFIGRLAEQKGVDLVLEAMDALLGREVQLVILGRGDARYEQALARLAREGRHAVRLAVLLSFDEEAAHRIEAAADIFLMPSRYEPCGLNQLYSLRYGTVPVVRATGGLEDTVEEFDPETLDGTGFKFREATPAAMLEALDRALAVFRSRDRKPWRVLMLNGMRKDFSWTASARTYSELYARLCR